MRILFLLTSLLFGLLIVGCGTEGTSTTVQNNNLQASVQPNPEQELPAPEIPAPEVMETATPARIVVANRSGRSLSLIDPETDTVVQTVTMPAAALPSVVGYVVYSSTTNRVYVGDEANSRVSVFEADDFSHVADLPVEDGIFHMWLNSNQLWITDRLNEAIFVYDINTNNRLARITLPADLTGLGGEAHDVVADDNFAYVTIAAVSGAPDVLLKYDTTNFQEVDRTDVGEDPHVFLHPSNGRIYVACQNTEEVLVLNQSDLSLVTNITTLGGHGVWIPPHGQALYVTNFPSHVAPGTPGGNANGLFAIDVNSNTVLAEIPAVFPRSHNLTTNLDATKLYMTHSTRIDNKVSVYDISDPSVAPRHLRNIDVGFNPFGIASVGQP